jgi:hypothetical protein
MFICPLCEHQQVVPGECEVCGKPLAARRTLNVPIPRLADLEVTRHSVGVVSAAELPEIERTDLGAVGTVPEESLPELDRGRASVGAIPLEALADLDAGRFEERTQRTPAPAGAVSCRYCRHVQAEGLLCDRCGMRLPRAAIAAPEDRLRVLHECGVLTRAGRACSSCGVYVPGPPE